VCVKVAISWFVLCVVHVLCVTLFCFLVDRVIDSLYPFSCAICLIMLFSLHFPSCVIGYELNLFCRYVNVDFLCSCGWHEVLCMVVLVAVGFLKILYSNFDCLLFTVVSRKSILLSNSDSIINFSFLLMWLKSYKLYKVLIC
jgi:hypothetical protein